MPTKDPEENVDQLEKLAYLIAEEFVRESELQMATALLTDPDLRLLKESFGKPEEVKVKSAGGAG